MLENLKAVWSLIKGRVITDLNLVGVAVLLWIVAHGHASVLPIVNLLPTELQSVVGFILPLVFGVVVQYAIVQTRSISPTDFTEATHIYTLAEHDLLDLLNAPNVQAAIKLALKDADEIGKPLVIGAITKEVPILTPVAEAIIEKVEEAAGIATGEAIPAGETHTPVSPIASGLTGIEPGPVA